MSSPTPASPPPPPPPVAATPGPLAARLVELFHGALTSTLRTVSYANFAACFPTPAARRPETLRAVWAQVVGKIESKSRDEFDGILRERDVVGALNTLEALLGEAKARRENAAGRDGGEAPAVVWHELPPAELFGAHLGPELEGARAELERTLAALEAENVELAGAVGAQREEAEGLTAALEAALRDLEAANLVLEDAVADAGGREGVRALAAEVGAD